MGGKPSDWPRNARKIGEQIPLSSWHPAVLRWLEERSPSWNGPAGVACSGGADSLCLLLLLWAHFPERRRDLRVLHFDHRLRGEDSCGDARFVEEVVRGLGLEVRFGTWERSEGETVNEETARVARFAFIDRELSGGGRPLFLGHQRDDIVESQLMRLSRGSGLGGLSAPRPVHEFGAGRRVHLRPLLTLSGERIRRALVELDIPFRVDASNATHGFYRNRIRLEVLPQWQEHSPFDVSAGAAASRELMQEDDDALETWLRQHLPAPVSGRHLDLRPLAGKPRALVRRALREWIAVEDLVKNLSKAAFERLLEAAMEGKRLKLSAGTDVFLEMEAEGLLRKIERHRGSPPFLDETWPLPPNGTVLFPGGKSLRARVFSLDPETRRRILAGDVESGTDAYAAWDGERLSVRHWRPGDKFRPLGSPGYRKLQDIFGDLKVSEKERYLLPVVLIESQILWTPCLPPAEQWKINPGTKRVVRLTYSCGGAV